MPYQVTTQPAGHAGIVLWQIENEYDFSKQPIDVKLNQLRYLAHASRDLGIDVPLLTCVTNNPAFHQDDYLRANVVQSANSYPGYSLKGLWTRHRSSADRSSRRSSAWSPSSRAGGSPRWAASCPTSRATTRPRSTG